MHIHSLEEHQKAQVLVANWIVKRVELLGKCRCCKAPSDKRALMPGIFNSLEDATGQHAARFSSFKLVCQSCGITEAFSVNAFLLETGMCPHLLAGVMAIFKEQGEEKLAQIEKEEKQRLTEEKLRKADSTPSSGLVN